MIRSTISKFFQSNYFIPFCFIIAVMFRGLWILLADCEPVSDSNWYFEKGVNIALGKGYTIDGLPTAYYPVGYPLFLGIIFKIFGVSLLGGRIANIVLYAGILYFSFCISKKIFNSELIGKITVLVLAVYPNQIAYSSILATEILFLFLFLLGTYILLISSNKLWILIPSGIAWGLMCLVKPQGFFLPIIILTLLYQNHKALLSRLKAYLLVYVFIMIVMLPWVIRNYFVYDEFFIVSTNDGINLLIGNNPYATGQYHLDDKVISYLWDNDNLYKSPDSLVKYLPLTEYWTSYGYKNENIANKKFRNKTLYYILNNPEKEIKLAVRKMWFNYKKGNDGIGWAIPDLSVYSKNMKTFIEIYSKIANYFYFIIIIFSAFYLLKSAYKNLIKKQHQLFPTTGLWIITYFTLLALIFFGGYRFNFPMVPWLVMYFGASIEGIVNKKHN